MSELIGFGLRRSRLFRDPDRVEHVMVRRPLRRVLEFTGRPIDDVVNSPIAKNHVRAYYKLHKFVQRRSEVVELERWWNG